MTWSDIASLGARVLELEARNLTLAHRRIDSEILATNQGVALGRVAEIVDRLAEIPEFAGAVADLRAALVVPVGQS